MKKNVLTKIKALSASLLMAFSLLPASAVELKASDLKKSGAKKFIYSIEDASDFMEKIDNISEDPFIDFIENDDSSFLLDLEILAEKIQQESAADNIKEFNEFLENYNSGKDFEQNLTMKDLEKSYNGTFSEIFKLLADKGINIKFDKYSEKLAVKKNADGESRDMDFDADVAAKMEFNLPKLLGPKSKSSFIKDMKILVGVEGNGKLNFNEEFFADIFNLIASAYSGDIENMNFDVLESKYGDFEPSDFISKVKDVYVNLKYDIGMGLSLNVDGVGGKVLLNVSFGVDSVIDAEFLGKIMAFADAVSAFDNPDSSIDFQAIMDFPIDINMSLKFCDDAGKDTFKLIEADSFGALMMNIMMLGV